VARAARATWSYGKGKDLWKGKSVVEQARVMLRWCCGRKRILGGSMICHHIGVLRVQKPGDVDSAVEPPKSRRTVGLARRALVTCFSVSVCRHAAMVRPRRAGGRPGRSCEWPGLPEVPTERACWLCDDRTHGGSWRLLRGSAMTRCAPRDAGLSRLRTVLGTPRLRRERVATMAGVEPSDYLGRSSGTRSQPSPASR